MATHKCYLTKEEIADLEAQKREIFGEIKTKLPDNRDLTPQPIKVSKVRKKPDQLRFL